MTLTQDSSSNRNSVDIATVQSLRNVRFTLRKKRTYNDRSKSEAAPVNLSSYNSDFLSGLFADVAKANVLKELSIELPSTSTEMAPSSVTETSCIEAHPCTHVVPDSMNSARPSKKSRLSIHASSYQSRASCMNLLSYHNQALGSNESGSLSPKGIDEFSRVEKESKTEKQDSLAYQLDCLEQDLPQEEVPVSRSLNTSGALSVSPASKGKKITKDVAALAFPNLNLPSTVSDSSCESNNVTSSGLTRERCLIQHGSALENAASASSGSKESFGWFVDLDDNDGTDAEQDDLRVPSDKNSSAQDLAFQAPTAPKRANNNVQEQMEQAFAADTIDSVLGDLF
eukprot:CAMPEP_0172378510 /NCGR_PEP_ID=MMETSP1060-20121228/69457_1 /TAXON_ID=37318 /ORGANISM="Pseudo-nitzschia pungens, Strain cf. cingulata" /LENGTH=340 /DNA_ID=CAMNT_0013106231 /DNA_START=345 /DNA_END=1367 /DNA_ORIENTATION=-